MGPTVYIETTIPSYLTARPSRDLFLLARQQRTREWWDRRAAFTLFSSRLVVDECRRGDPEAAAQRLAALADVPLLQVTSPATVLAHRLLTDVPLPDRAYLDALHMAAAAVHGMAYLLTWNCAHMANAVLRLRIEGVCRAAGFDPPVICTPDQLDLGETADV